MSIINAKPFIDFKLLFEENHTTLPNNIVYFNKGRDALLAGLKSMNIPSGSSIIVPAYICNSVLNPLILYGYNIVFIDVDKKLNLPLHKIIELSETNKISAIMIVNYFGFFSDINQIIDYCKLNNIKVIEDCAHSFLSSKNGLKAGSFGDIAIFSKRKTLPIFDGGGLKVNKPLKNILIKKTPFHKNFIFFIKLIIEFIISRLGWPNIYSNTFDKIKKHINKVSFSNKAKLFDISIINSFKPSFLLNKYLSNKNLLNKISDLRRNNFMRINKFALQLGFSSLHSNLMEGVVPQYVIIVDEQGGLVEFLRNNSIGAIRWPWQELPSEVSVSKNNFPNANFFNKHLVMIPTHQSLDENDFEKILNKLIFWKKIINEN